MYISYRLLSVKLKWLPAKMIPILSCWNGPHSPQVLIVFTAPHIVHSITELHMHAYAYQPYGIIYTWYVLLLKEEV